MMPIWPTSRAPPFLSTLCRNGSRGFRGSIDGDVEWPVFVAGIKYQAAFPARLPANVTSDLTSLVSAGLPNALVTAWAGAIPSLNALQIAAINDYGVLDGENLAVSAPT